MVCVFMNGLLVSDMQKGVWWMTVWQLVEQLIWIIEVYTIILKMDVL